MAWTKISELTELTTPTGEEELVYAKDWQNGKIKLWKITPIIVSWATFTTFLDACRANWSQHSVGLSSYYSQESSETTGRKSYTMQWYWRMDCRTSTARWATVSLRINWYMFCSFTSSESSWFAGTWEQKWITLKKWDVIEVYCSWYSGSSTASIKDFY